MQSWGGSEGRLRVPEHSQCISHVSRNTVLEKEENLPTNWMQLATEWLKKLGRSLSCRCSFSVTRAILLQTLESLHLVMFPNPWTSKLWTFKSPLVVTLKSLCSLRELENSLTGKQRSPTVQLLFQRFQRWKRHFCHLSKESHVYISGHLYFVTLSLYIV